jgi:predicted SprT family Zn-dependent metalloprotease
MEKLNFENLFNGENAVIKIKCVICDKVKTQEQMQTYRHLHGICRECHEIEETERKHNEVSPPPLIQCVVCREMLPVERCVDFNDLVRAVCALQKSPVIGVCRGCAE